MAPYQALTTLHAERVSMPTVIALAPASQFGNIKHICSYEIFRTTKRRERGV
jgi:hypothetical protein